MACSGKTVWEDKTHGQTRHAPDMEGDLWSLVVSRLATGHCHQVTGSAWRWWNEIRHPPKRRSNDGRHARSRGTATAVGACLDPMPRTGCSCSPATPGTLVAGHQTIT